MKLIAIGNIFMKDDSIGILTAEYLKDKFDEKDIEIIIAETDYQYGFDLIGEDDFIIILDSLYMENNPGSIHVFKLSDALKTPVYNRGQHDMNIIDIMKLYNKEYRGYIIGIEAAEIDFGNELSPVLNEKFPEICLKTEILLREFLKEEQNFA
ncbi:MAG: hydrogenase maturation protease [Eubacteriales bacterium]